MNAMMPPGNFRIAREPITSLPDRPAHKGYPGQVFTTEKIEAIRRENIRDMECYFESLRHPEQFHGGPC